MIEDLGSLIVTQNEVRNCKQVPDMIAHVQNGGVFDQALLNDYAWIKGVKPCGLIKVTVFEDGATYLQDGHHRCTSIILGGRNFLHPSEYVIEHWKYSNYAGIGWKNGWVTPYDVTTQVRLPDFKPFKDQVTAIVAEHGYEEAEKFIRANPHLYSAPRMVHTLTEFVELHRHLYDGNNPGKRLVLPPISVG